MTADGQGLETTVAHTWPFPPWVTLAILIGSVLLVGFVYARERGGRRRQRVLLATLRCAAIGAIVLMLYGWMRHRHRTDLPDVLVLIDDSQSMNVDDVSDDEQQRSAFQQRVRDAGFRQPTRFALAQTLLLERDARLLETLRQRYNLKLYLVGETARSQSLIPAAAPEGEPEVRLASDHDLRARLAALEPLSPASRLGKCLRDALEAQRGRPTAAVIVFTDGVTTEGKTLSEAADYARRKTVPLFVVGLGHDQPPRDVRLSDLLVDEVAFVGDLLPFEAKVVASGYAGQPAVVRLRDKERSTVLAERPITLGKNGEPVSVRLGHRPSEAGEFEFEVEVEPLPREANVDNNRQVRRVTVRNEAIRVLYVQEYPNFEFRFLKSVLSRGLKPGAREKAIELTTVLQEADLEYATQDESAARVFPVKRDELFRYDVLLFGDVNPSHLSHSVLENIAAFVVERGGGVVFLAGPRHTPHDYRDTPLAPLFPIDPATASVPDPDLILDQSFAPRLTPLGTQSPPLQLEDSPAANLQAWRTLPGLRWLVEAPDLRPGATVLLEHPTRSGSTGQKLPVVAVQYVGAGKVVFHATDETALWRLDDSGERYFQRYWLQTIRWLSRSKLLGTNRTAELTSDREEYRLGESVGLRLRFLDDRHAPAQDDGVALVWEREGGTRRNVKLRRDPANRGHFRGTLENLAAGNYRVWVATPTFDGPPPARQFSVRLPPGEQARLEMDSADLKLTAKKSQGKFYTLANVDQLPADLPRGRQVRIESLPPTPLWNSSWLAGTFVALITAEWLLRKRAGLP